MDEYISKQAFNDAIREAVRKYPNSFYNGLEVARQIAHDMDTADVAPVRHGRNISNSGFLCSECHFGDFGGFYGYKPNYCPNCGAKMG